MDHKKAPSEHQPHQILSGTTWHLRRLPAMHKFAYPYRYWGINLTSLAGGQTLPEIAVGQSRIRLFSTTYPALQRFCPSDYLMTNPSVLTPETKFQSTATKSADKSPEVMEQSANDLLTRANTLFQQLTSSQPEGDIIALVVCRNLGIYFSPVNFYIG